MQIWLVAYPIMIGNFAQTVINITDSIFLGKVGQVVFDASAIASLLYFVLYMAGFAFSVGTQIMIARKAGENKDSSIGEIFDNSIYIMLALSVVLFILVEYGCPLLLNHTLHSQPIAEASNTYLYYRGWGIPFAMINLAFRSFYVGIGKTNILTWNLGMMCVTNAAFCYLLIFGNYGFPTMGIGGAALASTIAEVIAFLFFLIFTIYHKANKRFLLLKFSSLNMKINKGIVSLSLPIVFQHFLSLGGWLVFFIFIENLGAHELAISNLLRLVYLIMMTPGWSFFAANNTLVSNLIGQGKNADVKALVRKVIIMSVFAGLVMLVLIVPFATTWFSFLNKDPLLISDAMPSFYLVSAALFLFAIAAILLSTVSGSGNTRAAMIIEGISVGLYLLYSYLVTIQWHLSIEVAWASEFVYWILIGGLCYWFLEKGKWQGKAI